MSVSLPRVCARQCLLALGVRILSTVKVFNLRVCLLHPSSNGNCISSLCSGSTLLPLPLPSWVLEGSETCAHEPKKSEQGGSAAGISVAGFSAWGSRTAIPAVPFYPLASRCLYLRVILDEIASLICNTLPFQFPIFRICLQL